jgi:multimeric flavodoxin WrbA
MTLNVDTSSITARILFINSSPDGDGLTEGLMNKAIEGAQSVRCTDTWTYEFKGKEMYPCKGCVEYCLKHNKCVIKDALHELINEWLKADGVVWCVPIYSFGTPTQVRSFIDRFGEMIFQSRWPERLPWWRFAKPIGTIVNGNSDHGGLEFETLGLISHYILINTIHVPGDELNSSSGVIGRYGDGEGIEDQPEVLEAAFGMGKRVAEMAKFLKAGKLSLASSLPDVYWCSTDNYLNSMRPAAEG